MIPLFCIGLRMQSRIILLVFFTTHHCPNYDFKSLKEFPFLNPFFVFIDRNSANYLLIIFFL
jgi:hypothetical protein